MKAPTLATHSGQLERWLGLEQTEHIANAMKDWYGPPIAIAGVPGKVYCSRGGDFRGKIAAGRFATAQCFAEDWLGRTIRAAKRGTPGQLNTGFSSLSALINAATVNGAKLTFPFQKVGNTGVANSTNTLWNVGNQPASGGNGSAAPGGRNPTNTTTGAFPYANVGNPGTILCFTRADILGTAVNTLLLYDRLFDVAKTMSSSSTEAVTGTLTRYGSTSSSSVSYSGGNFLFIECTGALAAVAHNWTTCTYLNQAGVSANLPSVTGNSSNINSRLDQPAGTWFAPLASGDIGINALTQMQCSSASVTGTINFVIGHPIAIVPCPIASIIVTVDGINTAFNLTQIFDNAALAFLEIVKPATAATTYTGLFEGVFG